MARSLRFLGLVVGWLSLGSTANAAPPGAVPPHHHQEVAPPKTIGGRRVLWAPHGEQGLMVPVRIKKPLPTKVNGKGYEWGRVSRADLQIAVASTGGPFETDKTRNPRQAEARQRALVSSVPVTRTEDGRFVPRPQKPPQLVVARSSGSKQGLAEVLEQHGHFEALKAVHGKPSAHEPEERSLPARMRVGARDIVSTKSPHSVWLVTGKDESGQDVAVRQRGPGKGPAEDAMVNEAHDRQAAVLTFMQSKLGRNGVTGKGDAVDSYVWKQPGAPSAAFNTDYENYHYYGNGRAWPTTTGVVGHEMGHGVVQASAKLTYRGESGALNEHFADVFGVAAQQWKAGATARQGDWAFHQKHFTSHGDVKDRFRSMANPALEGQPSHIKEYVHTDVDHGGVHVNSGIPNRAFYGAATRMGGHVAEKPTKIWYVTLRDYLRPDATFHDTARLTVHVAGKLYGAGSHEQRSVIAGWADVGIKVDPKGPLPRPRDKGYAIERH